MNTVFINIPVMFQKFAANIKPHYAEQNAAEMLALFRDQDALENMPVNQLMDLFAV